MESLKKRLESPSFWLSIVGGLGAVAAGLTDTGNPTLIAIGSGVIAVHAIGEALIDAFKVALPSIQTVAHDVTSGDLGDALAKSTALVPIVEEQVTNVQDLIKKVTDNIEILGYKARGYEVTPHVETTQVIPLSQGDGSSKTSHTLAVGGEHQIIGVQKP